MLRIVSFCFGILVVLTSGSACDGSAEPSFEVLPQDSLAVLLSESNGIPVGALADQRILAGRQHLLLSRLNPETGAAPEESLIQLELSPGPQLLDLGDDDEPIVVAFEAVSQDEIVGIELLRADEADLSPGTWVEVDVVGVTEDGTQVRSIHPRFSAGDDTHLGYFAYRFDPDAPARTLEIEALDWLQRTQFRGLASNSQK